MMDNKDILKELDKLIETLRDGQEGYREVSENVEDHQLKAVFSRYSQQRASFAGELQEYEHRLGKSDAEDDTSAAGKLHRGWLNLRDAVSKRDRKAMLDECERGDEHAVKRFT